MSAPSTPAHATATPGERLPGLPAPMHTWPGAEGLPIAGDSWGTPGAPLVILQHGGGQTRHAWKDTGEQLALLGYHVIAFDARGHGDSGWDPHVRYSTDWMIEDLRCVIEAVGGTRPALVGASMGGGVSLLAVGEKRVDASALVLVDVAPRIEVAGAQRIRDFMRQKPEGFDTLEEVAQAIHNYQPHRKQRRNLDGLAKNVRRTADGKYRWHWDPRRMTADLPDLIVRRERFAKAARELKIPTLLVRGELSDVLSQDGVDEFMALCPHARYVSVTGAAHMVAGDRNDAFGDAMRGFLREHVPVGAG